MSNRHTILRFSFSAVIAIIGLTISMLSYAQSGETVVDQPAGIGTITIEQKNAFDGVIGSWYLFKPEQQEQTGEGMSTTITDTPAGTYTIIVEVPDGMSPTIRLYRDTEQLEFVQRPQLTFKLAHGEHLTVGIHYSKSKVGTVSVQSDPPGINFTVTGPNSFLETGVTPASYENMSEGQYKVQYDALPGCVLPAPKSAQLQDKGRASFNIVISCSAADKLRKRDTSKSEEFVVVTIDGENVTLRDVPKDSWFATHVFDAARKEVLAGYKDANGIPTGEFGPGNNVTVAELAAIAHRLNGISTETFAGKNPENPAALNVWFSPFIASAEQRGWTIYNDATIDPLRPATRAEVVVTFLQALDIPLRWQKGSMFTDVTTRTRFSAAIETAAGDKIISGRTDSAGKPLNLFAPTEPINRAETAKIISSIFAVYKSAAKAPSARGQ